MHKINICCQITGKTFTPSTCWICWTLCDLYLKKTLDHSTALF